MFSKLSAFLYDSQEALKVKKETLGLGWLIAFAATVRVVYFGIHCFHMDEALFAGWALRMFEHGDLLLNGVGGVDKPPLLFYLQALSFALFGVSENAARIPNLLASLVSVGLLFSVVKHYFGSPSAWIAAWLLACSPLHIAFSNTAFTDPLMLCLCLASIDLLRRKNFRWAGVSFGLALATKQFAVLYLPLVLAALYAEGAGLKKTNEKGKGTGQYISFAQGLGFVLAGLLVVALFSNPPWGFITLQMQGREATMDSMVELGIRINFLYRKGLHILGLTVFNGWFILSLLGLASRDIYRLVQHHDRSAALPGLVVSVFLIGMVGLMVISHQPLYDRYLLMAAPLVCVVAARGFVWAWTMLKAVLVSPAWLQRTRWIAIILLVGLGLLAARDLEARRMGMGAFCTENDGIEQVLGFMRLQRKSNPVLMHNDSDWCYNFYSRGCQFQKRLQIESANQILDTLQRYPQGPWYLVWKGPIPAGLRESLGTADVRVQLEYQVLPSTAHTAHYSVFQLIPAAQPGE